MLWRKNKIKTEGRLVHEAGEKTGRGYVCGARESRRGRWLLCCLEYGIALAYIYIANAQTLRLQLRS
jgi:hypothetical protein